MFVRILTIILLPFILFGELEDSTQNQRDIYYDLYVTGQALDAVITTYGVNNYGFQELNPGIAWISKNYLILAVVKVGYAIIWYRWIKHLRKESPVEYKIGMVAHNVILYATILNNLRQIQNAKKARQ